MSDVSPQPAPRKQRMGQPAAAAPVNSESETAPAPLHTDEAASPQVRRTRMGAQAAATPSENSAARPPATHSPAAGTGTRQRMGAGGAAAAPMTSAVAAPATTARAVGPVAGAPRTRMGDPAASSPARPEPAETQDSPLVSSSATKAPTKQPANPWGKRVVAIGAVLVLAVAAVILAKWLRTFPEVQGFLSTYPGHSELPESAPTGLPAWIGWQHFLNMFFIVLIVRTGLQVRNEKKAPAYWKPNEGSFFSPKGATPKKVSLSQWVHQSLDVLWMLNGLVFVVLLFVTGQWMKIVPMSWDIIPNALSSALQYASLNWPDENGWIHYNALQVIAYFLTVFVAAPLAILSGVRFSTWWPDQNAKLSKLYPVEVARAIHFPVMLYFVGFTIVHVFLVFFTGAMRNLNHMYTSRDVADGWGIAVFAASVLVIAAGWWLTKPIFMRPVAAKTGTLSK